MRFLFIYGMYLKCIFYYFFFCHIGINIHVRTWFYRVGPYINTFLHHVRTNIHTWYFTCRTLHMYLIRHVETNICIFF